MKPVALVTACLAALLALSGGSCRRQSMSNDVVVQNSHYTVTADSVTEGPWTAWAPSDYEVVSNYAPHPADTAATQPVTYRHRWRVNGPAEGFPTYESPHRLVNALHNLSMHDLRAARHGSVYGTSARSPEATYSIMLALAYLDPARAQATLRSMVGSDGAIAPSGNQPWPIFAGDLAWPMAAWQVYCVTGSRQWLRWSYDVIKRTMDRDYDINHDPVTGLMHGGVTYTFNPSQIYPAWMEAKDVYETQSLTVNMMHERVFEILNDMADELGRDNGYGERALELKDAINETLWNEQRNSYSQYTYMSAYALQSACADNVGQALGVMWNVADDDRAENLMMKTPLSPYGMPVITPHYQSQDPLNLSETVSPTALALWNLAAAKVENEHMLRWGLGAMYRAQALFCANKSAWNAYTGQAIGREQADLCCAAANVAMVYRVLAGMTFLPNGIEFNPMVPVCLGGDKVIKGFRYRQATLDITIQGTGNYMETIWIDGVEGHDNFFPASLTGHHTVRIKLRNNNSTLQQVTVADSTYRMPLMPVVDWRGDSLHITRWNSDLRYRLIVNGRLAWGIADSVTRMRPDTASGLTVTAVAAIGRFAFSYVSQPRVVAHGATICPLQATLATGGDSVTVPCSVPAAGTYVLDLRYANGNRAVDAPGLCPTLAVVVNGHPQGTLVLPPLGLNDWQRTALTNMVHVELLAGHNTVALRRTDSVHDQPVRTMRLRVVRLQETKRAF